MRKQSKDKLKEPASVLRRVRRKRGRKKITLQIRVISGTPHRWFLPKNKDKDGWGTYPYRKYATLRDAHNAVETLKHSSFEAQYCECEFRVDPKFLNEETS